MRFIFIALFLCCFITCHPWGFHAHKSINYHAVFLLPEPLYSYFRPHIDDIRELATRADQRRYSVANEGMKHFIDLDHYEKAVPLDTVVKDLDSAIKVYTLDSIHLHGFLPWNLKFCFFSLVKAFKDNDTSKVIRKAADLGHYIADAHVPLHTTENYNGQLSGQEGIHGLWESRLPELFMSDYQLYGEEVEFIHDLDSFFWLIIEESYALKDEVLEKERLLNNIKHGVKYSFEQKGRSVIKVYSQEYSNSYHNALNNMVQERMILSIQRLANLWYTAYMISQYHDKTNKVLNASDSTLTDSTLINISIRDKLH